jgi:uncharacterized membrane protein HdeD (DUF308 family)
MLRSLGENWWVVVAQGVLAILFGIGAIGWPGLTLVALIALFGGYAIADGILALVGLFRASGQGTPWWMFLLRGIVGIGAGLGTFAYPGLTALILVYFIAARALLSGIFEVVGAVALRKEIENEWLLFAAGVVSIVFGVVLFRDPGAGALALAWTIGVFALISGGLLIALGFRVRGLRERVQTAVGQGSQTG